MIDTILALVPDYGLALVFGVVLLACLAVPMPASVLVLTAGSFVAAGDLAMAQTFAVTLAAFVIGDQIAFWLAAWGGPAILGRLRRARRIAPVVERSEVMLKRRGGLAVFLSHTILSPTCPYVSYLSGAGGLTWLRFSAAAIPGALIWSAGYLALGHAFASQLDRVAAIMSNALGAILAFCAVAACLALLASRWRAAQRAARQA